MKSSSNFTLLAELQADVGFAASSINAATSFGRDASEAWLASSVMTLRAYMRPDIRRWFSGAIIRS